MDMAYGYIGDYENECATRFWNYNIRVFFLCMLSWSASFPAMMVWHRVSLPEARMNEYIERYKRGHKRAQHVLYVKPKWNRFHELPSRYKKKKKTKQSYDSYIHAWHLLIVLHYTQITHARCKIKKTLITKVSAGDCWVGDREEYSTARNITDIIWILQAIYIWHYANNKLFPLLIQAFVCGLRIAFII